MPSFWWVISYSRVLRKNVWEINVFDFACLKKCILLLFFPGNFPGWFLGYKSFFQLETICHCPLIPHLLLEKAESHFCFSSFAGDLSLFKKIFSLYLVSWNVMMYPGLGLFSSIVLGTQKSPFTWKFMSLNSGISWVILWFFPSILSGLFLPIYDSNVWHSEPVF